MRLPDRLDVRVASDDESDLSDLTVEMIVRSGRKNPYHMYFPKTNRAGLTMLTRDDVVDQFGDHWEAGLMDYDGTIESADPVVHITLYDPTWSLQNRAAALAWPLLKNERAKCASREEQYRYRTTARNLDYIASSIVWM